MSTAPGEEFDLPISDVRIPYLHMSECVKENKKNMEKFTNLTTRFNEISQAMRTLNTTFEQITVVDEYLSLNRELDANCKALEELRKIKMEGENVNRNRISVILANKAIDQTLSITHTLWTMLGVLPKGAVQLPHRHQSVALDLILDCQPGCYTLVGTAINSSGGIINPTRVDWKSNSAFITPPGYWHAHFNESNCDANFIPIQDAGLQNYLRTLDIKFTLPNATLPTI